MLTIEGLKKCGVNTEEGMARCINNEAFYLRMVTKALSDNRLPSLKEAIKNGELEKAFEIAHGMKGMYGNLSLGPLYDVTCKITEALRARQNIDYGEMLALMEKYYDELVSLI